ncbi:hypothetical protein [Neobacillus piezotolerans]|uniref:hypothetical protein n=1 Tax=Neobacillus piezotolerans TaxID=2259171 RepID=UPI001FEA848C|nr:hypothetical protein [Neobacillus piezotolerans]
MGCTIVIGVIFYVGMKYHINLKREAEMTYNMFPTLIFTIVSPVVIGLLLRIPKLILEIIEKKKWTFDWVKIVAVGLPALYVALAPYLYYSPMGDYLPFAAVFASFGASTITTAAGIVFGYVLLDSLKKPD